MGHHCRFGQIGEILNHAARWKKGARSKPIVTGTFFLYSAATVLISLWNLEKAECLRNGHKAQSSPSLSCKLLVGSYIVYIICSAQERFSTWSLWLLKFNQTIFTVTFLKGIIPITVILPEYIHTTNTNHHIFPKIKSPAVCVQEFAVPVLARPRKLLQLHKRRYSKMSAV